MSKKQFEEFWNTFDGETVKEELEVEKFERNIVHTVKLLETHIFEGKFGVSLCMVFEKDGEKKKTYFNGFEREAIEKFVEGKELPLNVQFARSQVESQKNEGQVYNALRIREA